MTNTQEQIDSLKSDLYGAFAAERGGDISKLECTNRVQKAVDELVTVGRVSVLRDFDNMCAADAFVGFSDEEFAAVKKFFAFNKEISGWDK